MLAPNLKRSGHDTSAEQHLARVAECKPLLDRSIPLGFPLVSEADYRAIELYYGRKHRRGEYGAYYLHQAARFKNTVHQKRQWSKPLGADR